MQQDWVNDACDRAYQSVHGRDKGKDQIKRRKIQQARPQKVPWPVAIQHPHIMVAASSLFAGEYTTLRDFADWDEQNKQWVIWLVPRGG
jgi:hypothetical protein